MGGMDGQVMDEDNSNYIKTDPNSLTPRWQEIRDEWKDIRTNPSYILTDGKTIGEQLASTENSCLYCHGYHGQQFYDRTQAGEEELCYKCHGKVANYSRDDWNVYEQYNNYDVNGKLIGSRHGLTLREATIKCTSCHGQRAMTDRHVYEGYSTSIITNPNNIKQYWSDMRTKGKTINDYCNVCHKEADRKGRVLIETHTASKIVPYTVKYPPMLTTSSANGFDRTGYTLGDMYTYQENYASIAKVGAWLEDTTEGNQYESDAAVYSETGLDYVEFQFEGTYVAWTAKKDTDRGIAQVFIDGQPVHDAEYKLATDNPVADYRSGVDLYSGIPVWKFVAYQVSGLPIGTHTIRVQLTGLKNPLSSGIRIDLDSFKFAVPRVGHFLFYPDTGNCAGTCHDGLPAYIRDSQEAKTKITCVTCHHPHASENARLVHQGEDSKNQAGVVTKGACLHCHDGSVTK
jgi:predicted CXXCH cytochrome family protein